MTKQQHRNLRMLHALHSKKLGLENDPAKTGYWEALRKREREELVLLVKADAQNLLAEDQAVCQELLGITFGTLVARLNHLKGELELLPWCDPHTDEVHEEVDAMESFIEEVLETSESKVFGDE